MGSTIANLLIKMGLDSSGMDAGIGEAKSKISGLGDSLKGIGSVAGGFLLGNVIGDVATGVMQLASAGLDFGKEMANVNSIAQLSDTQIGQLSDKVIALSGDPRITQGPAELAAGLYDIVSAGFSSSDAMTILQQGAMAASAGITTTSTATGALISVLDAYHLKASDAGTVSNQLFEIVNAGVLTFEQLASTIGRIAPEASALGISVNDLGAAYTVLTRQGVSADEATTQMSAVMTGLLKPSTALKDALHAQGYESGYALIQAKGFGGALDFLYGMTGENVGMTADFFKNVRALRGMLGMTTDGMKDYTAAQDMMSHAQDGAGATAAALAKQMKSASYQIAQVKKEMVIAATIVMQALSPAIVALAKVVLFAMTTALIPLVMLLGKGFGVAFSLFSASISAAFWVVEQAVGGLNAILISLGINIGKIKQGFSDFIRVFHGTQANDPKNWGWGKLASDIDALGNAIKFVFGQNAFTDWLNNTAILVQNAINLYHRMVDHGVNPLAAAFEAFGFVLGGLGLKGLALFFVKLGESIGAAFKEFNNFKRLGVDPFVAAMYGVSAFFASQGMLGVSQWFTNLANDLQFHNWFAAFSLVSSGIGSFVEAITGLKNAVGYAFDGTKSWTDLLTRVPDWLNPISLGLIEIVSGLGKLYRGLTNNGIQGFVDAWTKGWHQISSGFGVLLDGIVGALASIGGALLDAFVGLDWGGIASAGWSVLTTAVLALATAGIDIGTALVNIGGWAWGTITTGLWDWVQGQYAYNGPGDGTGGIGNAAQGVTLKQVAVSILSWLPSEGESLAGKLVDWVVGTLWPPILASAITLGNYAIALGSWLISEAESLAMAVVDHVVSWWGTIITTAVTLGNYAIALGSWLISEADSLAGAVVDQVVAWWGTIISSAITLGNYAIALGSWLISEADSLAGAVVDKIAEWWPAVRDNVTTLTDKAVAITYKIAGDAAGFGTAIISTIAGLWPTVRDNATTLSDKLLDIGYKILNGAVGFGTAVVGAIAGLWPTVRDTATELSGKLVQLKDWAVGEVTAGDLVSRVKTWVQDALKGKGVTISDYKITVTTPGSSNVTIDGPAIWKDIKAAFNYQPPPPDAGEADSAYNSGYTAGSSLRELIMSGFRDSGNGGGGGGKDSTQSWMDVGLSYVKGITDGVTAPIQQWGNDFAQSLSDVGNQVQNAWDDLNNTIAGKGKHPWDFMNRGAGGKDPAVPGHMPSSQAGVIMGPNADQGGTVVTTLPDVGSGPDAGGFSIPAMDLTAFNKSLDTASTSMGVWVSNIGALATGAGSLFNTNLYTGMDAGQVSAEGVFTQIGTDEGVWVSNVGALATGAGNLFNTNLYAGMDAGQVSADGVFTQIGNDEGVWVSNVGALATGAGDLFNTNLYAGMLAGQTSAEGAFNQIVSDAGSFASNLGALGTSAGDQFKSGIQGGLGDAITSAYNAASGIQDALSLPDQYSNGYSVGQSLGQGLADGINSMAGAVADAALNLSNASSSTITQRNGIASPSKLYRMYGQYIGEGFALGMEDKADRVANALSRVSVPAFAGGGVSGLRSSAASSQIFQFGDIVIQGAEKDGRQLADEIMGYVAQELKLR